MARLKSTIAPFLTAYANAWTKPKVNRRRNSSEYSGPTGLPNMFRPEKPYSCWHIGQRRLSRSTSACRHSW